MAVTVLKIVMIVVSIVLIAAVSLQESRSDGLSGVIGGGAEQLFGKKKSKGYDEILSKVTMVGAAVFIVVALILVTLG